MAKIKIEIDTESIGAAPTISVIAASKIGVVSSIALPNALESAFKNGVNNSAIDVKIKDNCSYKKNSLQKLENEIRHFSNTADVIATTGGLVAYQAALSAPATKPFVSLAAELPAPTGLFKGGVSLESYQSNKDRIGILTGLSFGFGLANIGLFYNPNSAMNPQELSNWSNLVGTANQAFPGGVNSSGDNDANAYATDFGLTKIPATITALVISGDPFFQDTRAKLIAAANAWIAAGTAGTVRYICYPALAYQSGGGISPTPNRATLFGPDLPTAYSLLGQIAATVLSGAGGSLIRLPNIRRDL